MTLNWRGNCDLELRNQTSKKSNLLVNYFHNTNVFYFSDANSTEFNPNTSHPVVSQCLSLTGVYMVPKEHLWKMMFRDRRRTGS